MSDPSKTPPELDAIARIVLTHKPRPKTKAAKKRKKTAKRVSRLSAPKRAFP